MSTRVIAQFDYKYGDSEWRKDPEESFQLIEEVDTDYTVVFGQINRTRESHYVFLDPIAAASTDPVAGPTFFFADNTWRRDPYYSLALEKVITKTYEAYGTNSFQVTVEELDPLTGQISRTTSIQSGFGPDAPAVNTPFSRLIQQTTFGTLVDECIQAHFVDTKTALRLEWAETQEEVDRATRRQQQRDSSVKRRIQKAANPLMKLGQTIRVVNHKRDVDALHILTSKTTSMDLETGDFLDTLTLEEWLR